MRTKLSLLALTITISLASCVVSLLAQDSDSASLEYRARLIRDAAHAASHTASSPLFPQATTFQSGDQQSNYAIGLARNGNAAWRNFNPAVAKKISESNTAVDKLIEQLKNAESDEDKQSTKKGIQEELEKQYDFYLEQHEIPLKELEARLEKLRNEFEWRKSARDDLVKLRLDTIWYNAQGLGWPGDQSAPSILHRTYGIRGQNFFAPEFPQPPSLPAAIDQGPAR